MGTKKRSSSKGIKGEAAATKGRRGSSTGAQGRAAVEIEREEQQHGEEKKVGKKRRAADSREMAVGEAAAPAGGDDGWVLAALWMEGMMGGREAQMDGDYGWCYGAVVLVARRHAGLAAAAAGGGRSGEGERDGEDRKSVV